MDVFEKLYQKAAQSGFLKKKSKPGQLCFSDLNRYLDIFANSFCENSMQFQCVASRDFVGLYGTRIFLPEKINYFTDAALNRKLYQYLILQIMGAHRLKLIGSSALEVSIVQRLRFLEHSGGVNGFLDSLLPGYQSFQAELIKEVFTIANPRSGYPSCVFNFWQEHILSRSPMKASGEALVKNARSKDRVPGFLYFTVPSLEIHKTKSQILESQKKHSRETKSQYKTEIEKSYSGLNQEVNLDKEKANPIMHSFEKLETADEYTGGRTMDSGDDEISDHANALDELNLTKLTRGGEAAKSVFNADASIDFEFLQTKSENDLSGGHYYPEWNFKKNMYLADHCHLMVDPLKIQGTTLGFKETLLKKNRFQIKHWQSQIQSLFSEPNWLKKLPEGDEIDVDEAIRDFASMRCRQNVLARWYMSRKKQSNDVEIIVLFDQSQSSDSWVNNQRVLDLSLEAVGTAGLLFEKIFTAVTVAGIWSSTRHNCAFQTYKKSSQGWTAFFDRIDNIQPQGYTRLGPAIRHATSLLKSSAHKRKLILLLTDGKPTDVDGYEGKAGICDVAQACREAEANGILHYAVILDNKQKTHFSNMFRHYVLLHDPKLFSEELFKILFRLIKI